MFAHTFARVFGLYEIILIKKKSKFLIEVMIQYHLPQIALITFSFYKTLTQEVIKAELKAVYKV